MSEAASGNMATATPTRPSVFNLPNQLTAARFVLAIVLFVFIEFAWWLPCVGIFALAALTDWLDGYLARKQGLVSTLGRNLDPLVDKVVICGAYIFLLPLSGSGVTAGSGVTTWKGALVGRRAPGTTRALGVLED